MISAQCDELRAMAESVGMAMPQAATLMMEAADTITELRETLQRRNKQFDGMCEMWVERGVENAKLRELVIAQCECVKHDDCNECVHYSEDKCMFPFKSMYRELGVEVD